LEGNNFLFLLQKRLYYYVIFRLKRSGSGSLDELVATDGSEFQRGGVRATTGGRLGWSRELTTEYPQRNVV
jgi:hypothetical protein